ncbi:hypothetical protein JTB14_030494 [Gonioctena quinquepunctata]|nr:hypothetical protein JTB14_030494 [Gonioctena quinquepunctata]
MPTTILHFGPFEPTESDFGITAQMSSSGYNLRRPGERTNHHLDRDFVWPHHFGVDNTPNDISNQITCVSEPCIQTSENIPSQGQIVTNEVQNPENLHGIETIS